jgi:type I restriction enzyme M protein
VLSHDEEQLIIETFNKHEAKDDLSVVVSYEQIKGKNYSLSAGQYFDIKMEFVEISQSEFSEKVGEFHRRLDMLFAESKKLETEIKNRLDSVTYE